MTALAVSKKPASESLQTCATCPAKGRRRLLICGYPVKNTLGSDELYCDKCLKNLREAWEGALGQDA